MLQIGSNVFKSEDVRIQCLDCNKIKPYAGGKFVVAEEVRKTKGYD